MFNIGDLICAKTDSKFPSIYTVIDVKKHEILISYRNREFPIYENEFKHYKLYKQNETVFGGRCKDGLYRVEVKLSDLFGDDEISLSELKDLIFNFEYMFKYYYVLSVTFETKNSPSFILKLKEKE